MGALFFFLFLAIVFIIALFFILLNILFIIIWNIRKRKKKNIKKRWLVIPVIFLMISVIVALLPVGYIGFLRFANSANKDVIRYADSGLILYWPMGEYEPTTNWFEMNGEKYVEFRDGFSDEPFYIGYTEEMLGTPVANIKYDSSSSSPFNDFMWILLSGSTFYDQEISTLYPVENENGFDLFYAENSPGSASLAGGTYCAEDILDSTKAYYADLANYDTHNLVSQYYVYREAEDENNDINYEKIIKNITAKEGIFSELQKMYRSRESIYVEIPQEYKDNAKKAVPKTPCGGYQEIKLYAYSIDKMVYMEVNLILIDGQVYTGYMMDEDHMSGSILPDEINQYIIDTVFSD